MIKHGIIAVIILLLVASLTFAAPATVTYGEVAAVDTAQGVVVAAEAVTVPVSSPATAAPHKAVAAHKVTQRQAAAKATRAANEAELKKSEPKLKVNTTTTTTDAYDISVTNKRGTTDYGLVEETVTNPQGKRNTEGIVYSSYRPSKTARANAKEMEVSVAGGGTLFYNKDNHDGHYAKTGMSADVNLLKDTCPYLALGLDYMMLHPGSKTHGSGAGERHYHGTYAHNVSLAGKLTVNPWDSFQLYVPLGFGMMNARMKTVINGMDDGSQKWGASMYAGLGMQYDISASLFAGLEYRYAYGWIKDRDITPFSQDKNLQFHNVMLRLGMRF